MDHAKQEQLRSEYRRLYGLGLTPVSVNITSRVQDGVLKKVANFCTQWRGVTRDNCLDCYWPDGNSIAVRTGEESGVLVLDIDNASSEGKLNGMQLHEMWTLRHGELNTWTAKTGKDGLHLYFKFPTEARYGVNNRTGLVVEDRLYGVDVRGSGGVIFSPPSSYLAPDGNELKYEWLKSPFDTPLAEVPEWLEEVLIENDRIGNAFHPSSRPWNDAGGRQRRYDPEAAEKETYTLPGASNAPFRKYHLQDIAMCSGQQSIGLRSMLDTSDRVINEEDVTAEGLDEAAIDALMRENDGQSAVQRDRRQTELVRYEHTIAEIKTMLASHAKHPDKTSTYDSMHRGNIFSFRVRGPRTCVYNVHHNGSNNFSTKCVGRDVFYYCHGSICSRLQKQHIGRLSLRAYLERAPANPVSIHDSSIIRVIDSASFILSNFAKTENCKAAAHVYAAANKGGRVMVDKNDEFWIWAGTFYQQTGLTDIRYLAAEQLEFIARAYNDRLRQVYKDELRALGETEGCAVNLDQEAEAEEDGGGEGRGRKRARDSEAPQELKKPKFIDMKKLGNASFLDNTLRFVRAMLKQVDLTESFNQTPDLLSCTSGVIDLKTGELLPHHPRFLSTQQIGVAYTQQEPESTVWREFIGSIFNGDLEVITYMQMLLGYWISGDTSQSIFTVMTSPGGSGKSILVNALRETLGPIFATLHKDVLIDGKQASRGAADPNVMLLEGKHLAITEETGSLAKLDESVVKYLTGDSVISARDLFEKPKSFKLIAKIAICTNFPPKFDSTDWAMLRRLIYVPFPNTYVSEEKFDPNNPSHRIADVTLNDKLKTAEAKTEILWWLVQGSISFFAAKARDGLVLHRKPQAFRDAMNEYISENNPVDFWVNDACEVEKSNLNMYEQTSVLCARYKEDTSDFKMTPAVFGRIMRKMGFSNNENKKLYIPELGDQFRVIQGIRLK